jgi:hypothetical protein
MIRYLRIKKNKNTDKKYIIFRERNKKYSKKVKETYISKKKSILIRGLHASGKTREFEKILKEKESLYKNKEFIVLRGNESFTDWYNKNIKKKDIVKVLEDEELTEEEREVLEADIKKAHIKAHTLIKKADKAVLIIDDIDLVSGKKLEILKDMLKVCSVFVATCKQEDEINKTLLSIMKNKSYTLISLSSKEAYDATNILFMMFIVSLFATGNYSLAMLVMAGRYALKGQDLKK